MKTARKVLLLVLCAALLVSASVMGTMAYLTSKDTVTNTFTVGKVGITLDELDVDNDTKTDDNKTYGEGENATVRDQANAYKLMPGTTYTKDPTIHVDSSSENCYLFVKVVNEIAGIESNADGKSVAAQMTANNWKAVAGVDNVYVYATGENAKTAVAASTDVKVFGEFTIADTVNNATLDTYANKTIVVTAYAVQAEGFEDNTAADIWAAAFPST